MVYAMDPNNSVIKGLWCTIKMNFIKRKRSQLQIIIEVSLEVPQGNMMARCQKLGSIFYFKDKKQDKKKLFFFFLLSFQK